MSFNEWKNLTLGEVCVKITDGAHFSPKDDRAGLPMASVKDLTRYGVDISSCRRIGKEDFEYLRNQGCMPMKDDVLIAKDGNTSLDTVCVFNQNDKIVLLSSVAILRPDKKIISSNFLNYYFDNPVTRNFLKENFRSGSAIPRVVLRDFRKAPIRVPSLNVQKKITEVLRSLDNKIELNLQTNQTLEDIARTIFKEWFVNFNYPNTNGTRKYSEFGEIPTDWEILEIGEVCYVQNGYAFKSNDFNEEGEVGIIKIKNINCNVVDIEKTDFVDANVIERLDKKFKIESGSLLIAMTGAQVGKIGLVPLTEKNIWLNQRVGMFKEKITHGNLFMYLLLSSDIYQTTIQNSALGSAQPNISSSAIESIRAIIPSAELVEQFGKIVNPMFEKILDNLAENETLKNTRDSLLPKLMSGEIQVNISNE
jgi:type I restriction enzyme S subunit